MKEHLENTALDMDVQHDTHLCSDCFTSRDFDNGIRNWLYEVRVAYQVVAVDVGDRLRMHSCQHSALCPICSVKKIHTALVEGTLTPTAWP